MVIGTHDLILGTDWLKAHNPELNWTSSRIEFSHCPRSCILENPPVVINHFPISSPTCVISQVLPEEPMDPDTINSLGQEEFYLQFIQSKTTSPLVTL